MKKIALLLSIIMLFSVLTACKSTSPKEEAYIPASENEVLNTEHQNTEKDNAVTETKQPEVPDEKEQVSDQNQQSAESDLVIENSIEDELSTEQDDAQIEPSQPNAEKNHHKKDHSTGSAIIVEYANDIDNLESAVHNYSATDCFVGKITAIEKVKYSQEILDKYFGGEYKGEYSDNSYFRLNNDFQGIVFPLNADLYLYTVDVEQSVFSVFTEQGMKIKVLADISDMTEGYKIGEKYLMKGTRYQYEGKTVLRLLDQFRAKVDTNGTLTGLSRDAKIFEEVATIDSFISNTRVVSIFEKDITIPIEFSASYGVPTNELVTDAKNKTILDSIIADGKKAIIADSDFKMELKPTDAVK